MARRKKVELPPTNFDRVYEIEVDGWTIERGEIIKIKDEYGAKFKFDSLVTNKTTGSQWIDCFELFRGRSGVSRAFRIERIKRIPKKRSSGLVRRRKAS